MNRDEILRTNKHYRDTYADLWFGTAALPEYGVHFVTEDELHLFGDVSGKKMLEILLCNRKISAYVNALAKAGFAIEQMAEQTGRGGSARGGIQSPKIPKSPIALKGGCQPLSG